MPYLERNDTKVYYEVWGEGSGPWMTLLNGFTRGLTDFRSLGHHFTTLGWKVLALDNRGAGKTEGPLNFTLKDSVDDIQAVWTQVGCAKSHVLGISYGGLLAMHVAVAAQSNVASLSLVSTTARSQFLRLDAEGASNHHESEASLMRYFSPTFIKGHKILVRSLAKEMVKAFNEPEKLAKAQAQRNAMGTFNILPALSELRVPVLIVHGSDDRVVDIGAAGEIAQKVPHAKFEVLDGNGHLLLAEAPKRLYEIVEKFCLAEEKKAK